MIPHIYFAAYARYRSVPQVSDYLPGLPVPTDKEIAATFKKIPQKDTRTAKRWLSKHNLNNLSGRSKSIYAMFHDMQARNLIVVCSIMEEDDVLLDMLFRLGKWRFSENDLEYYRHLFWNTTEMSQEDLRAYLALLEGDDWYFLNAALSGEPFEIILKELGIHMAPRKNREVLDRMLMSSYHSFERADGLDKIKWGTFNLRIIKEMRNAEEIDPTAIIKELNFELGKPDIINQLEEGADII